MAPGALVPRAQDHVADGAHADEHGVGAGAVPVVHKLRKGKGVEVGAGACSRMSLPTARTSEPAARCTAVSSATVTETSSVEPASETETMVRPTASSVTMDGTKASTMRALLVMVTTEAVT